MTNGYNSHCNNCGSDHFVGHTRNTIDKCLKCTPSQMDIFENESVATIEVLPVILYNLEWKLKNRKTGEVWKQLLTNMTMEEFEIEYGNNIHYVVWLRFWRNDLELIDSVFPI